MELTWDGLEGNGFDPQLQKLNQLLERATAEGEVPGAVAVVAQRGRVLLHRAYGSAQLTPRVEPMHVTTLFDLASLTKVVATAPAVLCLAEEGVLRLQDRVAHFIPEFSGDQKEQVDLRHLLTHCSGLPAWRPFYKSASTPEAVLAAVCATPLEFPVGRHFQYSDLGFILLGEVVRRASGKSLDSFVRERLFEPLGMRDTRFCPPADAAPRCAATEVQEGIPIRGRVHDENAFAMGGVAGHAGLFSTAADLAVFCQMLLNGGEYGGVRVLSPLGVRAMLAPQSPCSGGARGFGFDLNSAYASVRGDLLPTGSAGHSGFTGTSIWIDRDLELFIVLLTNAVHPTRDRPAIRLRSRVSNVVAASLDASAAVIPDRVRDPVHVALGVDVLRDTGCACLAGASVGLVTNHTGRTSDGTPTLDVLLQAGVAVKALFSPEHGIAGVADELLSSQRDERSGLPVYSLYGETKRPLPEWLSGIDT
ncbi:MAG: serine hydrolase, partial [Armatimonadota bacterium]|nr:serine hydrolase [Armatimonadota bacterium]